uniref:26S proteasome non-ATPase regulatory subunit 5 n=1 Tax=Aceria tosichella TaxID=561515 RepID=A0A6G1S9N2_9ACAR
MKQDPAERLLEYENAVEQANRARDEPLSSDVVKRIEQLIEDSESTDDPVFQVNCLQLIADLACSPQAFKLLEEKQVPQKLIKLLQAEDPLIVPHALKLFYRANPALLEVKYKEVIDKICDYCQSDNRQLYDYAIDFLASLGRGGWAARKVLAGHPQFAEKCLKQLGTSIISSDSLIKSRALKCIHDLIEVHEDDPVADASTLSESFYFTIISGEHRMTNQLFALCKYPFMEIRVNALLVVGSIAGTEWGQKELASHPEFVTWILDRSTEKCKEGKEAKFEILKTLVKSRTATRHFKGEDYMKMRADFKKGPFHVGIAEEMLLDEKTG